MGHRAISCGKQLKTTSAQRRLGAVAHEVLWYGVNYTNTLVGNGVYIYTIHSPEGTLLMRDKIAVVR